MKLTINKEITDEDLDNIVDSAVSWCSYWCDLLEFGTEPTEKVDAMSQALTHGGTLVFHIEDAFEEGGKRTFVLTKYKMLKGLKRYMNESNTIDLDDFDGPMSDAALQMALFGEVIYG